MNWPKLLRILAIVCFVAGGGLCAYGIYHMVTCPPDQRDETSWPKQYPLSFGLMGIGFGGVILTSGVGLCRKAREIERRAPDVEIEEGERQVDYERARLKIDTELEEIRETRKQRAARKPRKRKHIIEQLAEAGKEREVLLKEHPELAADIEYWYKSECARIKAGRV